MTATIQLTLPMPPSGNHRNVGSGKHTVSYTPLTLPTTHYL